MKKQEKQEPDNNLNLLITFQEFKDIKNIDRESMMRIVEEAMSLILAKKYGEQSIFSIVINIDNGDWMIQRIRTIVPNDELENEFTEIELRDAIKFETDLEEGEELYETIKMSDFSRREILLLRQTLISYVMEYKKNSIYKMYKDRIGELITGNVERISRNDILVIDDEGNELILPKSEQIRSDRYRIGDKITSVISNVAIKGSTTTITLSRTSPLFLEKLLEREVPEIYDGLITIKKIVRYPGDRAKVLVQSFDDKIDPVGVCVGSKGSNIRDIIHELRNENIDIINYTSNFNLLVSRCLNPAKVTSLEVDDESKMISAYMKQDQISLAIGKGGSNIKLTSSLLDYEVNLFRDDVDVEEDIDLDEFSDEFDQWIIDIFKSIGCDTARDVLKLSREELINRTDLEEETVDDMVNCIKNEFDK